MHSCHSDIYNKTNNDDLMYRILMSLPIDLELKRKRITLLLAHIFIRLGYMNFMDVPKLRTSSHLTPIGKKIGGKKNL